MIKEEKKVANAENVAVPQSKPEKEMSPVGQNNTTTQQTPAPAIDPAIQNAIQQAVAGAVQMIMAQMTQPTGNQPSLNVAQPSQSNGLPPMRQPVAKLRGIPVNEGEDMRHVPAWKVNEWFRNIEKNAQQRVAKQGASMQAEMSWTRG